MTKYEPVTSKDVREFWSLVLKYPKGLDGMMIKPETAVSFYADLAHAEACLHEREAALRVATEALNIIACWIDGPEVDSSFDSPGDAAIARSALKRIKELTCPTS